MSRLVEHGTAPIEHMPRVWVRLVHRLATLGLLLAFAMGGVAVAQVAAPASDKPQVFDFEEDEISTDYLKPNTMMVEGLRRGRMSSLISVRLHFVDEIVRSAEDI